MFKFVTGIVVGVLLTMQAETQYHKFEKQVKEILQVVW